MNDEAVKSTKSWVALIGSIVTAVGASLMASLPSNDTVQVVGALIVGAVGAIATKVATFQIPNDPVEK